MSDTATHQYIHSTGRIFVPETPLWLLKSPPKNIAMKLWSSFTIFTCFSIGRTNTFLKGYHVKVNEPFKEPLRYRLTNLIWEYLTVLSGSSLVFWGPFTQRKIDVNSVSFFLCVYALRLLIKLSSTFAPWLLLRINRLHSRGLHAYDYIIKASVTFFL